MITNIAIIIPARNEEHTVTAFVTGLMSSYQKHISHVILVEDNSTDKTWQNMQKLSKRYPKVLLVRRSPPAGVGYAMREGIANLTDRDRYVLCMDCDFFTNIGDIKRMLAQISSYDGVVGSRFMPKGSRKRYPFMKLIANRAYHLLAQKMLGIPHYDLTNNFKLYTRSLVNRMAPLLTSGDFAINAELGYYPVVLGQSIGEVPVGWHERSATMGLSKFKILRVAPSYCKILFRCLRMKYF